MANREKRVKNPTEDWMETEESSVSTHSRKSQIVGAHQKNAKVVSKKFLPRIPGSSPVRPDELLAREPSGPVQVRIKHSPATSPEHWQRLDRVPKLRSPLQQPKPAPAVGPRHTGRRSARAAKMDDRRRSVRKQA
jgi:hypothetical protein